MKGEIMPEKTAPPWLLQAMMALQTAIWLAAIPWAMSIHGSVVRMETRIESLSNTIENDGAALAELISARIELAERIVRLEEKEKARVMRDKK